MEIEQVYFPKIYFININDDCSSLLSFITCFKVVLIVLIYFLFKLGDTMKNICFLFLSISAELTE